MKSSNRELIKAKKDLRVFLFMGTGRVIRSVSKALAGSLLCQSVRMLQI